MRGAVRVEGDTGMLLDKIDGGRVVQARTPAPKSTNPVPAKDEPATRLTPAPDVDTGASELKQQRDRAGRTVADAPARDARGGAKLRGARGAGDPTSDRGSVTQAAPASAPKSIDATPKDPTPDPATERQQRRLGGAFSPDASKADRVRAERYFADNDTYIDPKTGVRYRADYDPATGELELTRRKVKVHPATIPGGDQPRGAGAASLDAPTAPLTDTGAVEVGRGSIIRFGLGAGLGLPSGSTAVPKAGPASAQPRRSENHADEVKGLRAPSPFVAPSVGTRGSSSAATMDETIVLAFDGDRESTRVYRIGGEGDDEQLLVREIVSSSHDGVVTGGVVTRRGEIDGERGSETSDSIERFGAGGVLESRTIRQTTRTDDGALTTELGAARFDRGLPTDAKSRLEYRYGSVRALETTSTRYEDGRKVGATIEQQAVDTGEGLFGSLLPQVSSGTIEVAYGAEGQVTAVDGPAVEEGLTSLDRVVADVPTPSGETFRFSQVRATPGEIEGIPLPGLVTGAGIQVMEGDIPIFQEGGRVGEGGPGAQQIDDVRSYIRSTPPKMRATLLTVDLLDGRNPQDAFWAQKYDRPEFTSGATGGDGHMTFYLGGHSQGGFFHELGHISGVDGGAPDDAAWAEAIESDTGIDDKLVKGAKVVSNEEQVLFDGTDGVTEYADSSYKASGSEGEDWADSVELWLASRRNDGLVTVRTPDGREQTYDFEDLYPGRAALIEEHYA